MKNVSLPFLLSAINFDSFFFLFSNNKQNCATRISKFLCTPFLCREAITINETVKIALSVTLWKVYFTKRLPPFSIFYKRTFISRAHQRLSEKGNAHKSPTARREINFNYYHSFFLPSRLIIFPLSRSIIDEWNGTIRVSSLEKRANNGGRSKDVQRIRTERERKGRRIIRKENDFAEWDEWLE